MAEIDDGGPAFPLADDETKCDFINEGMRLRDWFAGQALASMQGVLFYENVAETNHAVRRHCANAYAIADAMLTARKGDLT